MPVAEKIESPFTITLRSYYFSKSAIAILIAHELSCSEENINLQLDYQLKLLYVVSCFHKLTDVVDMHVSVDKPLVIQYNMETDSYIRFMIAPKIGED